MLFFSFLFEKKYHVTQHQNCPCYPCCCLASKYIYIFISRVIVNESKQAQRAGQRSDAAGGRGRIKRPRHHTLAPDRFIYPLTQSAAIPSPSLTPLCYWDVGRGLGWGGAVNGALIQQQLLFLGFVFSLKMYSVVSFSCFF